MATKVGRGKIRLAPFDGLYPKLHTDAENLADISCTRRVIANFSQISLPWQQGLVGRKCD